ncbi:MAG TPA: O-antigen ligase family protein, partial [Thermoleophilaceae bacterium]|nr:O-antigen ligase family protein [Thermoleophilaceae bacterium]
RLGAAGKAALGALAVVAVAGAVAAADPGPVLDGFKQLGFDRGERALDLVSAAGGGRYQFWSAAVAEFQAYPVAGGGAGSFEVWWAANPQFPYFVRDAHSLYLETLGELGPGGLALLLGALGYGLLTALRRLRGRTGAARVTVAALSATLLAWALAAGIDWMWEMPLVTGVAILCLGLMTGPAAAPRAPASAPVEQATARARRGRRSFNVGVAVIAAAWLVICAQGALLLSQLRLEDSRSAAARGDFDVAAHAARGAQTLQPWAGTPYRQLALIEQDRGNTAGARRFIEAAIEREPGNFELWEIAARIETAAGNTEAAGRRRERSISLNPRRRAGTATAGG